MSVSEQRYKAVLAVIADGRTVTEVARDWGVHRQTLHRWLVRYEAGGLEGLGDGSQCRSQSSLTTHQPEADTSTICMSGDAPARQDAPFGMDRYMAEVHSTMIEGNDGTVRSPTST